VVSDTGVGMTPDGVTKALEAFGQVNRGANHAHEGTGLGLPITIALMELHDGALDIESAPGAGTRVTLRFPAERSITSP
jgi:signal transduction histidine kinase